MKTNLTKKEIKKLIIQGRKKDVAQTKYKEQLEKYYSLIRETLKTADIVQVSDVTNLPLRMIIELKDSLLYDKLLK